MRFRVWAPDRESVQVVLYAGDGGTETGRVDLARDERGWFTGQIPGGSHGVLYKFRVDDRGPYPDPCSRAQPFGVHGPSQVLDPSFAWTDASWKGIPLDDLVVYEAHVGTFTPEGTFDAMIPKLAHLRELGITALEILPVASFPGARNWGYDGVFWYAPAEVYGGPAGLKRLVDAAHRAGLAVILDVVYNHLGPDGNYLRAISEQYHHPRHSTPWGDGVHLDGPEPAREFVIANAEMWVRDYHVDGLRLDATHSIRDTRTPHVLSEIARRARLAAPGREVLVIAEDDRNDARLVEPVTAGGSGLDAIWADDFQRQLFRIVVGDREGYFLDYADRMDELARTLDSGWLFQGDWSRHWQAQRGTEAARVPPLRLIHSVQNHDQTGNRAQGERLSSLVSPALFRAVSALLLLSPYTPLIFMGQEWNARTPFQFFTDHHPDLGRSVTEGRRREFEKYRAFSRSDVPDPQDPATFERSRLDWSEVQRDPACAGALNLYRTLLALRREHPALRDRTRGSYSVRPLGEAGLELTRRGGGRELRAIFGLREGVECVLPAGSWVEVLNTEQREFGGPGSGTALEGGRVKLESTGAIVVAKDGGAKG